jgi:hypothetical protein
MHKVHGHYVQLSPQRLKVTNLRKRTKKPAGNFVSELGNTGTHLAFLLNSRGEGEKKDSEMHASKHSPNLIYSYLLCELCVSQCTVRLAMK